MQSLTNNARHYCRKGHVREAKGLKMTLFYHESSCNMFTLSNIHWSQSEWVVTMQSRPFKCLILETVLRGQANPPCPTQLVRWEKNLGQSQALYSLLPAPNIQVSSLQKWCYDVSSSCKPYASSLWACDYDSTKSKYISSNILCVCMHMYIYMHIHIYIHTHTYVAALQPNYLYYLAPLATLLMKQSDHCIVNQDVVIGY